ncbi:glycosyltransferase family 1 protein [Palleronia sediminis]|uniref:Glycosyltransferase family 1 protein n=1 Tax=Palleronia sediminis TaxID=2547833 RepID=A0A4R6AAG0_9RHOB|nr:glycosyltransferase [Palleronia sediminis]TDL79862.1 glycosyltransferase family 1 protein [Palleronia sediminis]
MHIVHVLTRLARGGAEENTLATAEWQAAAGHCVTVIHGGRAECPVPRGVAAAACAPLVHPVAPRADLAALRALRRLYRDLGPDVIHTHQSKAGILGRLAADAAPGAIVIHGIHIVPFESVGTGPAALFRGAERLAARRTHGFIAVTDAAACAYVDAGIAPREKVAVVRSGMDLARFRGAAPPQDAAALSGRVPGGARRPLAVMLASFEPRKRQAALIAAIARRGAGALGGLRLVLAGDGPERAAVARLIATHGLAEHVVLAGHRDDPERLLAIADLSVLVSAREGLPRAAVQSLAAGRPVVSTALPGLAELVHDGRNGVLCGPDDMDGVVTALGRIARDRALWRRLAAGAAATDVSDWALDLLGRRTTEAYARFAPALRRAA